MADPHPLVEAVARAMARELNAAESPGFDQLHVSWLNAALAAARVILSAEPSASNAALLREIEGDTDAS